MPQHFQGKIPWSARQQQNNFMLFCVQIFTDFIHKIKLCVDGPVADTERNLNIVQPRAGKTETLWYRWGEPSSPGPPSSETAEKRRTLHKSNLLLIYYGQEVKSTHSERIRLLPWDGSAPGRRSHFLGKRLGHGHQDEADVKHSDSGSQNHNQTVSVDLAEIRSDRRARHETRRKRGGNLSGQRQKHSYNVHTRVILVFTQIKTLKVLV